MPGHGKGKDKDKKKPKGNTIDKFLAKGWQEIRLGAGERTTNVIPIDPEVDDVALFGRQFDESGTPLKRHLHVFVREVENGAVIETATLPQQDVRLLFKVVEEGEEEEEDTPAPF